MSKERESESGSSDVTDSEPGDENLLQRWSRRKAAARDGLIAEDNDREVVGQADGEPSATSVETETLPDLPDETGEAAEDMPGDEDMPAIDDLTDDDDYSAFFSPGVSPGLRKKALARLFHSPKFNIRDGLDDYDDDYTTFKPLGNIITAEMRHRAEDLLRRQMEAAERAIEESSDTNIEEAEKVAAGSEDQAGSDAPESLDGAGASDLEEDRKNDT